MARPWHPRVVRWYPRLMGAFLLGSWLLKAADCLLAPTWSLVDGRGWRPVLNLSRLPSPACRRRRAPRIRVLLMAGRGGGRSGGRGRGRGSPPSDAFRLGEEERLQKFLSHAGLESRRQCEQMILDGRVIVNGKVVKELGVKVDPRRDQVRVDGDRVSMRPQSEVKWVAINKPKGVICTLSDELGRPTAVDVVPRGRELRLVPVGRLDRDSCGLLLMTNENSWVNPLTHPSYGHEKTYRVSITSGYPNAEEWNTLTQGMLLDGDPNPTRPCIVEIVDFDRRTLITTVNVIIREGKNRQIRRMFEGIGHDVKSITRIAHGPIRLKGLRPGEWRSLEAWEVEKLKNLTTKTLKSPRRLSSESATSLTRDLAGNSITPQSSRRSPQATNQRTSAASAAASVKYVLDQEEDEWNRGGAWDRRAMVRRVVSDDDLEWHTTSWARENEERNRGGGSSGGNKRRRRKVGRKVRVTEADRILEKLKKGDELKAPAWEGGGRVEREGRSVAKGKGSWSPWRG